MDNRENEENMETSDKDIPQRPSQVKIAVWLLYASLYISFLAELQLFLQYSTGYMESHSIVGRIIGYLFRLFIIVMISRKKSWARFVNLFTVYATVVKAYPLISDLISMFDRKSIIDPISIYSILYPIIVLMLIASAVLLFLPSSNAWFRYKVKNEKQEV